MRSISFQPPEIPQVNLNENLITDTLHITIATPMVGGGVVAGKVDFGRPVRVSSIRGNLRYWWRMLNLDDEATIWGSTDSKSKVFVEVTEFSQLRLREHGKNFDFPRYGTEAYALFAAATNEDDIAREGLKFTLKLTYPKKFQKDVKVAVSAWVYFGGIGARTRRGCGTLSCDEKLSSVNEVLKAASGITLWRKLLRGNPDSMLAWKEPLELYRRYRQDRNPGPGRSKWPEPDSIREITGDSDPKHRKHITSPLPSFPRAALGLPIIFHFVGRGEPKDVQLKPKDSNRMSSPVITKALCENGVWYSAVIILPHEHVFKAKLETNINKPVNIPELHGPMYKTVKPMRGQTDAIAGFEAFIREKAFKKEEVKA